MTAVSWPTVAELKQRLDVPSTDWDDQLGRVLAAAIEQTKQRVGNWVEDYDSPNENLAQSALELAVEFGVAGDGVSLQTAKSRVLLYGRRRRFGIG